MSHGPEIPIFVDSKQIKKIWFIVSINIANSWKRSYADSKPKLSQCPTPSPPLPMFPISVMQNFPQYISLMNTSPHKLRFIIGNTVCLVSSTAKAQMPTECCTNKKIWHGGIQDGGDAWVNYAMADWVSGGIKTLSLIRSWTENPLWFVLKRESPLK